MQNIFCFLYKFLINSYNFAETLVLSKMLNSKEANMFDIAVIQQGQEK